MSEQTLKQKTLRGSVWSFVDSVSNQGITFVVGLVLARILTSEEYGLIGIIMVFIAVFNSIVDSGFSNALIRKTDAKDVDYNTVFITNMALSAVLFCVMFAAAPAMARFFDRPQLEPLSRVMASIVVINALAIIQRTILVKRIDFKTQTKVSLISSLVSGAVGIGMAVAGCGVWALVGQQVSRQVLNSAFLWLFAEWFPRLQFSMRSFRELFGFGWKLLTSGLIDTLWRESYQLVIGKVYAPSMLGQYTRAYQFSTIASSNLTAMVQRVSYPVLSSIREDEQRLKYAYKRVIKVTMLVTFVLMLGMAAVAEPMVRVLIGDKWLPCVPFLQILCLNMMLYPLHALNLNMLQVQGRSDLFLRLEIIKKIIAVGPMLLGIFVDIYWMLWGSLLAGLIACYLNAYYSGPLLGYGIVEQVRDIMPSLGIACAMAVPVYALSWLPLSPFVLLPLQIMLGAVLTLALCEWRKTEEYIEIKGVAVSVLQRIK